MKGPVIKPSQRDIEAAEKKREEAKKRKKLKEKKLAKEKAAKEKRRQLKNNSAMSDLPNRKKQRDWYTNKSLSDFVNKNGVMMKLLIVITVLSIVPFGIGIFNLISGVEDDSYYVPHIVFGGTGLFLVCVGVGVDGTLAVIKSYFPMCGDTKFTRAQVDSQANSPDTILLKDTGIFLAPDMIIGSSAGVCAVAYEDVDSLRIKESYNRVRVGMRHENVLENRYREFFTYRIVVRTKRGKRIAISYSCGEPKEALKVICEHCRKHGQDVKVLKMRKSLFSEKHEG